MVNRSFRLLKAIDLHKNVWVYFFLITLFVFLVNRGYETFLFRPCSFHQWRQSDGASYALNYYQNNISFLPTQVNHRYALDGRAMSEFPIVYYLASLLYRLFGFHDYYIRLIHFSIFILGLIYIVKITSLYTQYLVFRLTPFLFTITSPYIFFYAANFLPDVAALSLSIAGFYYFLIFRKNLKLKNLYLMCFFFTLSALLKMSDIILFASVIGYYVVHIVNKSDFLLKIKTNQKLHIIFLICLSVLIIFSWMHYDKYIAEKYHFGGNLFGFLGIWDSKEEFIFYVISRIYRCWMHVIMAKYVWIGLLGIYIYLFFNYKRIRDELKITILFSSILVFLYLLAWFQVFDVHDYYMINIFCLPILIIVTFIDVIDKMGWIVRKVNRYSVYIAIVILGLYATYKSSQEQRYRYYGQEYNTFNKDYYDLEPYLRRIGINRNDLVLSVPDPSPNITLYLMNQIGFTECYNSDNYNINYFVSAEHIKYLIVGDSNYYNNPIYKPYCKKENKIGQFKSIAIFKTR